MKSKGFTLIELMVVLVIVAILVAYAYPNYVGHMQRASRVDAQQMLSRGAQVMERNASTNNTYLNLDGTTPTAATVFGSATVSSGGSTVRYNMSLVATARTYTLTATPVGGQASDVCGTLTINQAAQNTPNLAGCW